jgi:hypothetical protein
MAAKRRGGPGKMKRSHSYKTKKRLEAKHRMLAKRVEKTRKQRRLHI